MKLRFLLSMLPFLFLGAFAQATTHIVSNAGLTFTPDVINVTVGDTIVFNISNSHNAVEVTKETYDARGIASNGGFIIPFGGGSFVVTEAKTYYYVCTPHVRFDMIGQIIATDPAAMDTDDVFIAQLRGSNEVLPIMTRATGEVTATLSDSTLTVTGSFSGLGSDFNVEIAGGAHIHKGFAGQNGGVEILLNTTVDEDLRGGTFEADSNTFTLTAEQIELLRNRQAYINIHSTNAPSGELRGQLLPQSDAYYFTNMFGSNEVPAVMTAASGALTLELIEDTLVVTGAFMNLQGKLATDIAGGVHLHVGLAGENGGVQIPLNVTLDEGNKSGSFEATNNSFVLTAEQKALLEARAMYVNIHSTAARSGEIRGQIRGAANVAFRADMSGNNEVVPVTTAATGGLLLELDGGQLTVSGTFQNLSSALNTEIAGGAHIHFGLAGQNGGVEFVLNSVIDSAATSGSFAAAENVFELSTDQVSNIFGRRNYVNIHSLNFGSGEIRGQIVPESQFFMHGFLTGMQEADPVLSAGSGNVIVEVRGNRIFLTGAFNNLNTPLNTDIGTHLHLAAAGSNGPVAFPLNPTLTEDGRSGEFTPAVNNFELTDGLIDTLRNRGFYVNVHSQGVPSGELRAQLLHEATAYFFANLSGASEVEPVNTAASGAIAFEWNAGTVIASGSFNDLSSPLNTEILGGAHLHFGLPGQNGGVIYVINPTTSDDNLSAQFNVADNILSVSSAFPDTIVNRMVYVNIHSTDNGMGEIRGQVLPFANAYFTATLNGINEVPYTPSIGTGAFKLELNGTQLAVTGSFTGLTGDFAPEIGGGSHIHAGTAGATGGVAFPLTVVLADNNKSGTYMPDSNTFDLTEEQLTLLNTGGLYFNIHTSEFNPGEIRGQILPETNQFPTAPSIATPAEGAVINIEGEGTTPFEVTWTESMDMDGDSVAYVWQLALDPAFFFTALTVNTGKSPVFASDFNTIDGLLALGGLDIGSEVTLYHRAIATDGSLSVIGEAKSVNVIRGVVTDVDDAILKQMSVKTYPNPASNQLKVEIQAVQNLDANLIIVDQMGRVLANRDMELFNGENNTIVDVQSFATGSYFVQIWIEGKLLKSNKVLIQR